MIDSVGNIQRVGGVYPTRVTLQNHHSHACL